MSTRILLYVCRWDYEPCHCRHLGNSFSLQSLSWYSICCCFQVLCIASVMRSYQIGKGKHFEIWSLISSTALQWLVTKHHSFLAFSHWKGVVYHFLSLLLFTLWLTFFLWCFLRWIFWVFLPCPPPPATIMSTLKKIQSEFNSENVSVLKCHNFSLIDWLETFGQSTTFSLYRSAKKILYFHLLLYLWRVCVCCFKTICCRSPLDAITPFPSNSKM